MSVCTSTSALGRCSVALWQRMPVRTLVRADDAEERELDIGMNRGDLRPMDYIGTVIREGLPP